MNEAGWINYWEKKLYDEVYWIGPSEARDRLKPNDEHFQRVEEKLGARLPTSYRAFIKVFGPGFLARFPIYSPGYKGTIVDLLGHNKWHEMESEHRPEPDRIKRTIAFSEYGYELIVWDITQLIDPECCEYNIYRLPRDYGTGLSYVTNSFKSFIEERLPSRWICKDTRRCIRAVLARRRNWGTAFNSMLRPDWRQSKVKDLICKLIRRYPEPLPTTGGACEWLLGGGFTFGQAVTPASSTYLVAVFA